MKKLNFLSVRSANNNKHSREFSINAELVMDEETEELIKVIDAGNIASELISKRISTSVLDVADSVFKSNKNIRGIEVKTDNRWYTEVERSGAVKTIDAEFFINAFDDDHAELRTIYRNFDDNGDVPEIDVTLSNAGYDEQFANEFKRAVHLVEPSATPKHWNVQDDPTGKSGDK